MVLHTLVVAAVARSPMLLQRAHLMGDQLVGLFSETDLDSAIAFALDVDSPVIARAMNRSAASRAAFISGTPRSALGGINEVGCDKDHSLDSASDDEIALEPQRALTSNE